MKCVLSFSPEALLFEIEGSFTFSDTSAFKNVLLAIKENNSRHEVRLNINKLESVDHTGLRLMMMAHDFAKKVHSSLVFVGAKGQVLSALVEASQYNALNLAA